MNDPTGVASPFPPPDRTQRQLTVRAVLTGMVLGGVLSLCNVYSGLLIGWGFNMSVTAALLAFGFWRSVGVAHRGSAPFGLLENNINQTAASAAASISSAGLVAPIPALTLLTGHEFTWPVLVVWTFVVSLCGIVVAVGLRRQMLLVDRLPFPSGIATAETVKEMYARGAEAIVRLEMLLAGAVVAAGLKVATELWKIPKLALPGGYAAGGALPASGVQSVTLKNLGFALDPSLLLFAMGGIIGIRASAAVLIGSVLGWGVLAPYAMSVGWAQADAAHLDAPWYGSVLKWLLWPGVSMMVMASLTSFAFSWRSVLRAVTGGAERDPGEPDDSEEVSRPVFLGALAIVLVAATTAQILFFGISWWTAILGVLLTFVLAIVAGRVSGETGVTPVGAMGKVTQLVFGVISPGNATANLMTANVTGGAASQCADLLHDMKTGLLIGASPRKQAVAQVGGAFAGAMLGSLGYLIILPNPREMLLTPEWPAPAVAAWKAVAEIFMRGIEAMPPGALEAIVVAGALGVVLAILEKVLPAKARVWVPSPSAMGLALVIPAWNAISIFLGGLAGMLLHRYATRWSDRFLIVLASGMVAGESLAGVGVAIEKVIASLGR